MRLEHSEAFRDSVSAARDILDALVDQQGAYYRKKVCSTCQVARRTNVGPETYTNNCSLSTMYEQHTQGAL